MARKPKNKNHPEPESMGSECFDCLEALVKCVFELNPATRAMLKEKAESTCKSCAHFHTIKKK